MEVLAVRAATQMEVPEVQVVMQGQPMVPESLSLEMAVLVAQGVPAVRAVVQMAVTAVLAVLEAMAVLVVTAAAVVQLTVVIALH